MTLLEIRTQIRSIIDEKQETAVLLNSELNNYINARYHTLCNEIVELHEDYFLTTATASIVANQQSYNLPQDSSSRNEVMRLKRVEIAYDGSNWHIAYPIDLTEKIDTESQDTAYSTFQPYYFLMGNTINFLPTPDTARTDKIKYWYVERQANLSADTDIPAIPDEYHHVIVYGAAADAKRMEGDVADYALVQDLENKFEQELVRMRKTIQPRVIQTPKFVKNVEDMPGRYNEDWVNPGSLT